LPVWLQNYLEWHANQRSAYNQHQVAASAAAPSQDTTTKFVVLVCFESQTCGGLSDRLRSIPYLLKLANATNRVFLIHWKRFDLEEFLVPPMGGLDWTVPTQILQSKQSCLSNEKPVSRIHKHNWNDHTTSLLRNSRAEVVCVYAMRKAICIRKSKPLLPPPRRNRMGRMPKSFTPCLNHRRPP
jgi:hypothetical protein